jgi:hypothetical protein
MSEPGAACPRFGKLIGGCRFEARYDFGASTFDVAGIEWTGQDVGAKLKALAEQYRPQYYVRDVCIRCGRTVERERQVVGLTKSTGPMMFEPVPRRGAVDI